MRRALLVWGRYFFINENSVCFVKFRIFIRVVVYKYEYGLCCFVSRTLSLWQLLLLARHAYLDVTVNVWIGIPKNKGILDFHAAVEC